MSEEKKEQLRVREEEEKAKNDPTLKMRKSIEQ